MKDLGPPCKALGEGVAENGDEGGNAKGDGSPVVTEQDQGGDGGLQDHPDGGLPDSDLTGWQRAAAGAGDLRVDMAVGDIIPGAACATHEKGPKGAAEGDPDIPCAPCGCGSGKRKAPKAGDEQQPCADGAVSAGQAQVGAHRGRGKAVNPVAGGGVGDGVVIKDGSLWRSGGLGHRFMPWMRRSDFM